MADIISEASKLDMMFASPSKDDGGEGVAANHGAERLYWYVEALFFAYRDFISDPDRILQNIGFGRAHHRILHFVHRYPGMRVADLLDILQITKQSLSRVLRELVKSGYILQRPGKADKRERLLYVTQKGEALAIELAASQLHRIQEALKAAGVDGEAAVMRFLIAVMSGKAGSTHRADEALTRIVRTMGKT